MANNTFVIGAGAWGAALAHALKASGNPVTIYSIELEDLNRDIGIRITNDVKELKNASHIYVVIPAQVMRIFCDTIKNIVSKDCVIINCSKGIETKTGLMMSEVVRKILPDNSYCALSGPNFASEISRGLPAITTIASADITVARKLSDTFSTPTFKLVPSDDLVTTELCGAYKNCLAIACGIARGLNLGENFVASLITKGVNELMTFAQSKGGKIESTLSAACIGDVFLTCGSLTSRNTRFGQALVENQASQALGTVEGVHTTLALKDKNLPIVNFLHELIYGSCKDRDAIEKGIKQLL